MFEEAAALFALLISDQVELVKLFQLFEVQKLLAIEGKYKKSNIIITLLFIY